MKLSHILLVAALVLATRSMLPAQVVLDAKTAKAIEETEKELELARAATDAANRRLQDVYANLAAKFELVRSGRDVDAVRDLARVLGPSLDAANAAGFASSRGKRALGKGLPRELAKVEHELLKAFVKALPTAVDGAYDGIVAEGAKDAEAEAFAAATIARLLPAEIPFWHHWNESLRTEAPGAEAYVEARKNQDELEGKLLVLRDPKMRFAVKAPSGMARVDGTAITIESLYGFKVDRRKDRVRDFYIDLREVTHGEYWGRFWINLEDKALKQAYMPMIKDKDREYPAWVQDPETGEYAPLPEFTNRPVTGIDVIAAQAFAASQGKRLPTEAEWLAAATATPGKCSEYPWGEEYREGLCNDSKAAVGASREVGGPPEARSYYGLHDMAGNVKEWTLTTEEGKNVEDVPDGAVLAIRGGSYESSQSGVSLKWRWKYPARNTHENDLGFRCAMDVK